MPESMIATPTPRPSGDDDDKPRVARRNEDSGASQEPGRRAGRADDGVRRQAGNVRVARQRLEVRDGNIDGKGIDRRVIAADEVAAGGEELAKGGGGPGAGGHDDPLGAANGGGLDRSLESQVHVQRTVLSGRRTGEDADEEREQQRRNAQAMSASHGPTPQQFASHNGSGGDKSRQAQERTGVTPEPEIVEKGRLEWGWAITEQGPAAEDGKFCNLLSVSRPASMFHTGTRVCPNETPPGTRSAASAKARRERLESFVLLAVVLQPGPGIARMATMFDVIIIGAGPAGLSAALLLGRCCRSILVCDAGTPRNRRSHALHGYLSRDGIRPLDLRSKGREELARYGVEVRAVVVEDARRDEDGFAVRLADGREERCRKLLLATGVRDDVPSADGFDACYGRSVFHCPYCDGWEVRGRRLALYARGRSGVGMALALLDWSPHVLLVTDGPARLSKDESRRLAHHAVRVRQERLSRLDHDDGQVRDIVFEAG